MIYFLYGGESITRLKKLGELQVKLEKENKGAPFIKIESGDVSEEKLDELSFGQGLFNELQIIVMRDALENKELKELFVKKIKSLSSSANIFVITEPSSTKEIVSKVEKAGGKTEELGLKEKAPQKDNSGFLIADAVGRRDRKLAWALYQESLSKDATPEELHGIIFWQIKNLLLAKNGVSGKLSYPMMKAKSFAPKWEEGELKKVLSRMVSIYHDSHRGKSELTLALEILLLDTV